MIILSRLTGPAGEQPHKYARNRFEHIYGAPQFAVTRSPLGFALLLSVFSFLFMASEGSAMTFDEANAKYKAGDYKAAAKGYQGMIDAGKGTASVSYNLGNALLRSGKKAQALLAYLRALRSDPRNRDIRWNIGVVESALTDRAENGNPFWLRSLREAVSWISIDETAAALLGALVLLALLAWIGFAVPGVRARLAILQVLIVPLALILAALFAFQLREEERRIAVVLEPEAVLRYGPAFSETRAFVLHEGAAAEILDESGDWWYVSFGKNAGWIPKKTCEVL